MYMFFIQGCYFIKGASVQVNKGYSIVPTVYLAGISFSEVSINCLMMKPYWLVRFLTKNTIKYTCMIVKATTSVWHDIFAIVV